MKSNLHRLFSSILIEIPQPKLGFAGSRPTILLSSSRLITSSVHHQHQHQHQHEDEIPKEDSKKEDERVSTSESSSESDSDMEVVDGELVNKKTGEIGGPRGPEPTRFGDWEQKGRCTDF